MDFSGVIGVPQIGVCIPERDAIVEVTREINDGCPIRAFARSMILAGKTWQTIAARTWPVIWLTCTKYRGSLAGKVVRPADHVWLERSCPRHSSTISTHQAEIPAPKF
jgi:hypothetical protein